MLRVELPVADMLPLEMFAPRQTAQGIAGGNSGSTPAAVEIVAEKDVPTYASMISKYDLPSDTTWMIGNSPRSDINPALQAGINAVLVPHGNTWILEQDEVIQTPPDTRMLVVEDFAGLRNHF